MTILFSCLKSDSSSRNTVRDINASLIPVLKLMRLLSNGTSASCMFGLTVGFEEGVVDAAETCLLSGRVSMVLSIFGFGVYEVSFL